ncbi:hypothetical protein OF001_U360002 [Pseudomonas sp. OF001]|nr:hypothetical protein OF001_U360002 [Pseudomonas sp. OF001]
MLVFDSPKGQCSLLLGMCVHPCTGYVAHARHQLSFSQVDKTHGISVNRVCIRVLAAGRRGVLSVVFLIIIVFFKTNDQAVVSSSALKFGSSRDRGEERIDRQGSR